VVAARVWLDLIRQHAPDCLRLAQGCASPAPTWGVEAVLRGLDLD